MTSYTHMLKSKAARIAVEAQLLAEEKWIIEALQSIKRQRNCLQIERLHLEGQKIILKKYFKDSEHEYEAFPDPHSPTSASELAELQARMVEDWQDRAWQEMSETRILDEEELCNDQELNLSVTAPMFGVSTYVYDEEEEDNMATNDEIEMDMNMLVNGAHQEIID